MPEFKNPRCQAENRALICMLAPDHEGLHYDDIDDVSWKDGKPDA
jgi:hypothetical protein